MALKTKEGRAPRTTDDLMEAWVDRAIERGKSDDHRECSSIIVHGDRIFHYGRHFALAQIIRDDRERPRLFLLNGDSWGNGAGFGPTTASRQGTMRRLVAATNVPYVVIPFSALDSARIDRTTIEVEDSSDERWTTHAVVVDDAPGPQAKGYDNDAQAYYPIEGEWTVERGVPAHCWPEGNATRTPDGRYTFRVRRHWLGDTLFRARQSFKSGRKSFYLSSFDYNEPRPLYFLCELPRYLKRDGQTVPCKPGTIAQALDDLRPNEVVQAQRAGLDVIRQGDVFAIPTSLTTRELTKRAVEGANRRLVEVPHTYVSASGERFESTVHVHQDFPAKILKGAHVLDTNHKVTEVVITVDGDTYARGIMRHAPGGWRGPDHRNVKLGDGRTWYRLLKNTVPTDGTTRAWTISGNVD